MTTAGGSLSTEAQVSRLAELYSKRAAAYDALWSPVIRPIGEMLLDRLPLAAAQDVIDIGCGTGALLPSIRSRAPEATVLGVDRSDGMLAFAAKKHSGPLRVMDAGDLDLPPASFDVAVLAFVLFHLPAPERCLEQVIRILRPGGSVGVVTWADEEPPPANTIWDQELKAAGAIAVELPAVDNDAACDSPEKLRDLLEGAGFGVDEIWSDEVVHDWPPADHLEWHLQSTSRVRLESLDPETRKSCLQKVVERLPAVGSGGYRFRGGVLLATATKAGSI